MERWPRCCTSTTTTTCSRLTSTTSTSSNISSTIQKASTSPALPIKGWKIWALFRMFETKIDFKVCHQIFSSDFIPESPEMNTLWLSWLSYPDPWDYLILIKSSWCAVIWIRQKVHFGASQVILILILSHGRSIDKLVFWESLIKINLPAKLVAIWHSQAYNQLCALISCTFPRQK